MKRGMQQQMQQQQQQFATKFDSTAAAMQWCAKMARLARPFARQTGGVAATAEAAAVACIVLDIDKTIVKGNGRPIREVITFARYVTTKLKYPLYLVTARPDFESNRKWTVNQLATLGFAPEGSRLARQQRTSKLLTNTKKTSGAGATMIPYRRLYMMPMHDYTKSMSGDPAAFSNYKWRCRMLGVKERVLINVGDQWDDLVKRPPKNHVQAAMHMQMYQVENAVLRSTRGKGVVVGVNVSPCSLISVKLPA